MKIIDNVMKPVYVGVMRVAHKDPCNPSGQGVAWISPEGRWYAVPDGVGHGTWALHQVVYRNGLFAITGEWRKLVRDPKVGAAPSLLEVGLHQTDANPHVSFKVPGEVLVLGGPDLGAYVWEHEDSYLRGFILRVEQEEGDLGSPIRRRLKFVGIVHYVLGFAQCYLVGHTFDLVLESRLALDRLSKGRHVRRAKATGGTLLQEWKKHLTELWVDVRDADQVGA